jgi:histidine triad (HIT) family protein
MASIFTKIINREIPGLIVAEDEHHIAILDINPLVMGHTLAIPKREVDYIYDLSDNELEALNVFAKKVAIGLKQAVPCKRIGISVIGLEVPHTHIHLIPLTIMDDMSFSRAKLKPSTEELSILKDKIAAQIKL